MRWSRSSATAGQQGEGVGDLGPSKPPPIRSDAFFLPPADEDIIGQVQIVTARHEDSLPDLARRFDLGINEIVQANPGVDIWLPGEGTRVVLPTRFTLPDAPRKGIVLNVATMRLFYYPKPKDGEPAIVITHPVGIGRVNWRTPLGTSKITAKAENPSWYPPASIRKEHKEAGDPLPRVVPPGPDNPLGSHAMRLSIRGYLIHGTNKRYGIGMRISHGCIRMYPEDIERLFHEVPTGTPVNIVNQPYVVGWSNGVLHLESHVPLEEDSEAWGDSMEPLVEAIHRKAEHMVDSVDWNKAAKVFRHPRGVPVPITAGGYGYEGIVAGAMEVENSGPPVVLPASAAAETEEDLPAPASSESVQTAAEPRDLTAYLEQTDEKYPFFSR